MLYSKLKKTLLISVCIVILFAILVILLISPIAKYLIEKYDEKWTGRQITLSYAYINPFTGYCYFKNVKFYEEKKDSVFLAIDGLSGDFAMKKMLFDGLYEVSQLTLNHPWGNIIQHKKDFNFTSFITHISGENEDTIEIKKDTIKEAAKFNILNIKIKSGEFHYLQEEIPVVYFIKDANIESAGKLWDADTVEFKFSFHSGPSTGSLDGNYTVNFKNLDFHYFINVHDFDLKQLEQYLKPMTNYGTFRAKLDASMHSTGNFSSADNVTTRGNLAISDFHFGKNVNDDYASFERLALSIDELSPINKKYIFDSMELIHPMFKYEQYDQLDNLQTMFGKAGENIEAVSKNAQFNLVVEIARYTKLLSRNFFNSYYKINNFSVTDADFKFNDYSLPEKYSVSVSPLDVTADSIDKNKKRVNIYFKTGIKPYGNASITLNMNPKDTGDFDMEYHFHKIPASTFNPYLLAYTSFPLDRGTVELNGTWAVREGKIHSNNHLLIIDPRVTKRVKNKSEKWLPMPLIMSFVREYGNVIDYEIPITGNLKHPHFHLRDVLFDILANIFVKPPMTPYRMEVRNLEAEIEKSYNLKWPMRATSLSSQQEKFVNKISDFLEKNPEASITVTPMEYAAKEKEYILLFEAKKKYYLSANKLDAQEFSEEDSEKVSKMSNKDSLFVLYLNKHIGDKSLLFTVQDKCSKLVSSSVVNSKFKELSRTREKVFRSYFEEAGLNKRIKIKDAESTIPYNGFSFYQIEYKGDFPESLNKAYQKIQELNDKPPRKKYEGERKKTKLWI